MSSIKVPSILEISLELLIIRFPSLPQVSNIVSISLLLDIFAVRKPRAHSDSLEKEQNENNHTSTDLRLFDQHSIWLPLSKKDRLL